MMTSSKHQHRTYLPCGSPANAGRSSWLSNYEFAPPYGGVFRSSACCKLARVTCDRLFATGGMFGYFRRRPHLDLAAALASMVSRKNRHIRLRPPLRDNREQTVEAMPSIHGLSLHGDCPRRCDCTRARSSARRNNPCFVGLAAESRWLPRSGSGQWRGRGRTTSLAANS